MGESAPRLLLREGACSGVEGESLHGKGAMMRAVRSERGFLSFSAIVALLAVAVMIFLAMKLLPPYIDNYQLQDGIENLTRTATYSRMTEQDVRGEVIALARDLGIVLKESQVAVQVTRSSVSIAVSYDIPVDLMARQVVLSFQPQAGNRNIMAK